MNINDIKQLISAVSNSNIRDFQYEEDGVKLCLANGNCGTVTEVIERKAVPDMEIGEEIAEDILEETTERKAVKSPLVGTVYMAPGEGEEPFVSVGDHVKKGQTLAIVEAMKLMNEIESEYDGIVKEICVDNETPVEFGQELFIIE